MHAVFLFSLQKFDGVLRVGIWLHPGHGDGVHVIAKEALHFCQGRGLHVPYAGQIRLAIGGARRRSRQVWPAVSSAWNPRRGIVNPLRTHAVPENGEESAQQQRSHLRALFAQTVEANRLRTRRSAGGFRLPFGARRSYGSCAQQDSDRNDAI